MDLQPYLPHIALFFTCVLPGLGVLAFVVLSALEYWQGRKREDYELRSRVQPEVESE